MSLWDIGKEGHLDLSTLIQNFQGKSIIILNNTFKGNDNIFIDPLNLLDPYQFYQAINNYNINFYMVD